VTDEEKEIVESKGIRTRLRPKVALAAVAVAFE